MYHSGEFKGQGEQEIALYITRAHWVALALRLLAHMFAWGIIGFIALLVFDVTIAGERSFSLAALLEESWLVTLWLGTVLSGAVYVLTMWHLTVFVITDTRLMTFVQTGLFSSYAIELKFANIKDSSYAYRNALHYIFNYGVFIARSSPGAIERFEVPNIQNPRDLHHYVHKLVVLTDEARQKGQTPALPPFRRKWGKRHMQREVQQQ